MSELSAETIDHWIALTENERSYALSAYKDDVEPVAIALKDAVDQAQRNNDLPKARLILTILADLFEQTDDPIVKAIYHRAEGNTYLPTGQWQEAITRYRKAAVTS